MFQDEQSARGMGGGGDLSSVSRERVRGDRYGSRSGGRMSPAQHRPQPTRSRYGSRPSNDSGGGFGVDPERQSRMIGDAESGRAAGPDNRMSPGTFGGFGGQMLSNRELLSRIPASDFKKRPGKLSQMPGFVRDRFLGMGRGMGPAPEPPPPGGPEMGPPPATPQASAPRPGTGLAGLVSANNANIRGRGGELNEPPPGPQRYAASTSGGASGYGRDYGVPMERGGMNSRRIYEDLYRQVEGMDPGQRIDLERQAAIDQGFYDPSSEPGRMGGLGELFRRRQMMQQTIR